MGHLAMWKDLQLWTSDVEDQGRRPAVNLSKASLAWPVDSNLKKSVDKFLQ